MRKLRGDFRDIFYSFGIALDPKKLFLALIGIVFTIIVVGFSNFYLGWTFAQRKQELRKEYLVGVNSFKEYVTSRLVDANDEGRRVIRWELAVPYYALIKASLIDTPVMVYTKPRELIPLRTKIVYGAFTLLLLTIIWSFFGGAITRLVAYRFAKDEGLDLKKALKFGTKNYGSYFWSIWSCILAFLFFFLCIFIVVLIGHGLFAIWQPLGYIAMAFMLLLLPLALVAGFLMVLIMIGGVFGSLLFSPAISSEGTDAFDGISRGFSYVYSRPWHYAFYNVIGLAYGVVSVLFVWICTYLLTKFTLWAAFYGLGGEGHFGLSFGKFIDRLVEFASLGPDKTYNVGDYVCSIIFGIWMFLVLGFALSYVVSYFYTYRTIVYFLLRKKVDGYEMEEVYEEKEEEEEEVEERWKAETKPAEQISSSAETGNPPSSQ